MFLRADVVRTGDEPCAIPATRYLVADVERIRHTRVVQDFAVIEDQRGNFAERILYVNNVADPDRVAFYAGKLVERDVITRYVFVDQHAREALDFFGLDRDSFRGGYYYSIQELVGIYLCRTEYLLHFAGDSILEGPFHWIEQGIAKLEEDPRVKVVNCVPDGSVCEAEAQAYEQDDTFWLGYGFSDQCYLVRTADYKQRIFDETHPAPACADYR